MTRGEYARMVRGKSIILLDYFNLSPIDKYETMEDCSEDLGISPSTLSGAVSKYPGFPIGYLHKEKLAFVLEENLDILIQMQKHDYSYFID